MEKIEEIKRSVEEIIAKVEKMLSKPYDELSPKIIRTIQLELPTFVNEGKTWLDKGLKLSREVEDIFIEIDSFRLKITRKAQVFMPTLLGGSLLVWLTLLPKTKAVLLIMVVAILLGTLGTVVWWFRKIKEIRELELRATRMREDLRRLMELVEKVQVAIIKIVEYIAAGTKETSQ